MLKPISKILPQSIEKHSLAKQIEAARICALAQKVCPNFKIISFKNGILKLSASSSSEANEIGNRERELVRTINEGLKHETVRKIRTVVV